MKNSIEILDAIARAHGDCSDYRISKLTGIAPAKISAIRNGHCSMSRANCKKAAAILGVEPGALIAIAQAEREEDQEIAASLLRVANQGLAAAVVAATVTNCLLCKVVTGNKRTPRTRTFPVSFPPLAAAITSGFATV
jgi:hypothetical protein